MKSRHVLFVLLLLCLAVIAIGLVACGSSSSGNGSGNNNQPLDVTSGTWTITISPSNSVITAKFTTFTCSKTDVYIGPSWYDPNPFSTTSGVCISATPTAKSSGFTPQGLALGLSTNPVPANGTTTLTSGAAFYAQLNTDGVDSDLYDLTGTITASNKTISGSFSCDPNCTTCSGDTGTFTGTMK